MTLTTRCKTTYVETFDDGPGGWIGWESNARGALKLDVYDGMAVSTGPWWIDYNHAPPGGGYLHLPFCLMTREYPTDPAQYRELGGPNRFVDEGFPTDFRGARITLRIRGDVDLHGASLMLLVQSKIGRLAVNHVLTAQPFPVTADWTSPSVIAEPDPRQWRPMGSRHDRTDFYGDGPIEEVLRDVNRDIILVLFPLDVVPHALLNGEMHRLRAGEDYPVDRTRLPQGTLMLDEVKIEFDD